MSARPVDIIARVINMRDAETVEEKLTAAGYRILAPGELDPETVTACARECDRIDNECGMEAGLAGSCATAIRSLGRPQP